MPFRRLVMEAFDAPLFYCLLICGTDSTTLAWLFFLFFDLDLSQWRCTAPWAPRLLEKVAVLSAALLYPLPSPLYSSISSLYPLFLSAALQDFQLAAPSYTAHHHHFASPARWLLLALLPPVAPLLPAAPTAGQSAAGMSTSAAP